MDKHLASVFGYRRDTNSLRMPKQYANHGYAPICESGQYYPIGVNITLQLKECKPIVTVECQMCSELVSYVDCLRRITWHSCSDGRSSGFGSEIVRTPQDDISTVMSKVKIVFFRKRGGYPCLSTRQQNLFTRRS